ncbi:MAG: hypothetical protein NTV88_01635 [Candidatus Micrarchaeota archaeon]|nr:hypothetical protein [Candidatus Micrarchaeota archaeon]
MKPTIHSRSGFLKEALFSLVVLIVIWYLPFLKEILWQALLVLIIYCALIIRNDRKRLIVFLLALLAVIGVVVSSSIQGAPFLSHYGDKAAQAMINVLGFFAPIVFLLMETAAFGFRLMDKKKPVV